MGISRPRADWESVRSGRSRRMGRHDRLAIPQRRRLLCPRRGSAALGEHVRVELGDVVYVVDGPHISLPRGPSEAAR